MVSMEQRSLVYADMRDLIGQAYGAARREGFSALMVGNSYAVITGDADLDDVLGGCLMELVEQLLREGTRSLGTGRSLTEPRPEPR